MSMDTPGSFVTRLLHRLRYFPKVTDTRLAVSNLTRGMTLATCATIADRGDLRRKGLLGRDSLPRGDGLWILPCQSVHTFGMKFPIDLVYVEGNNRVRKVRSGVRPWRLSACLSAHSVLELPSGTISETGTQRGDALQFRPFTSDN